MSNTKGTSPKPPIPHLAQGRINQFHYAYFNYGESFDYNLFGHDEGTESIIKLVERMRGNDFLPENLDLGVDKQP